MKMILFSRVIYLSFVASFFVLGIYNYLTDFEENNCEMTYMFEWPKYLVRALFFDVDSSRVQACICVVCYNFIFVQI